jgi:hypothetical protein
MANADYTLDAVELAQIAAWKENHWHHGPCPVCGNEAWETGPRIAYFNNDQTPIDGTSYPVLLIYCAVCGYTISISARVAGLRPRPGEA